MDVNEEVKKLAPHLMQAKAYLTQKNCDEAERQAFQFFSGCVDIYSIFERTWNYDYARAVLLGATSAAQIHSQMLNIEYTLDRHYQGRDYADTAIKLANRLLKEKDDPRNALNYVGAVEKGLGFGLSDDVREHLPEAERWLAKLVSYFPNNEEVKTVAHNFNKAKELAEQKENYYQSQYKNHRSLLPPKPSSLCDIYCLI